jgi:hypothetical protein
MTDDPYDSVAGSGGHCAPAPSKGVVGVKPRRGARRGREGVSCLWSPPLGNKPHAVRLAGRTPPVLSLGIAGHRAGVFRLSDGSRVSAPDGGIVECHQPVNSCRHVRW